MGWAGLWEKDGVRPAPYQCSYAGMVSCSIKDYAVIITF